MQTADLSIKLVADIADLQRKMLEAQRSVNGAMANIAKAANMAKVALAGVGVGIGIEAFKSFIKGAIDAGDEMNKLSQKTGVAVERIAGLQLAYRQAGLDSDKLQSSLSKLSVAITSGNDALKVMGIATANADGSLKSTRDVLGLVADKFASYRDGAEKTALAVQLFGKSGADLIPLLNQGAGALDEFDRLAQQLGLTMDAKTAAAAEKFNDTIDLIGQGVQGTGRKLAAELLPTLQSLADAFLTAANNSSLMKTVGTILKTVFQTVTVMGSEVVFVVYQMVKGVVALGEAGWNVVKFNLANAKAVIDKYNEEAADARVELDRFQETVMGTGSAAVESMAAITSSGKQAAPVVNDLADKARKARQEFEALASRITGKDSGLDADFFKNLATLKDGLDKAYVSLEQYVQLVETYIKQQKFYQDQLKAEADLLKEFERDGVERAKQREKEIEDRAKQLKSVEEMIDQIRFEADALKMTNVERETAIKLRELENKGIAQGTKEYEQYAEQIRQAVEAREATEASIKQQQEYAKQWEKITDQIGQALANSLMDGGKSAWEYLKNLFRTLVLRPLLDPIIRGVTGTMAGTMGMAGTASAATGSSVGAVNVMTVLNNGYNLLKTGFASMTGALGEQIRNVADFFIQSSNTTIAEFGNAIYRNSEFLAEAAGTLGNAAAAYGIQKFISGGYKVGDGKVVDVLTAVGGAIFGPIAGVVAGVFNRAFGRKLVAAGIMGDFGGAMGFAGSNYKFEKGGWFRSDKTSTSPLDPVVQDALAKQFLSIQGAVKSMANALGNATTQVDGYTKAIKVNLMGLSPEKAQAKLQEVFADISEELAVVALRQIAGAELKAAGRLNQGFVANGLAISDYIKGFQQSGETAADTLKRLSTAISVVNQAFDTLGYTLLQASLSGADLASQLADAFGGVENFTKAINSFYGEFYDEAERTTIATRQLTQTFAAMGLQLPATRDAYRSLVESLDVTTDKGRNLFAALVQLAPTFALITKSAEQLRQDAIDAAQAATDNALRALEQAIDAQKASIEVTRQVAQESVSNLKSIFDVLSGAIDELTGQIGGMTAAQGQAFIDQAISAARATGYLPESGQLSNAIAAVRGGMGTRSYASAFEAERDRLLLAGKLNDLRGLTGDQLTVAEKTLQTAQDQLAALDAQLQAGRQQIESIRGLAIPILSVTDAVNLMNATVSSEIRVLNSSVASYQAQSAAQAATATAAQSASTQATPQTMTLVQAVAKLKEAGIAYGGQAGSTLRTTQDIANYFGATLTSSSGSVLKTPQYAAGGLFDGGMRLVGENGPELEVTGPARYYSSANTAAMLGGGAEVADEIRQLREENRAQSRALVGLQNRMTKLLEQWDGDGIPETRNVAA